MTGIYYVNVASQILFYAIFALGLNVLVGYGGLVSLGHAGLFGVTAYADRLHAAAGLRPLHRDPRSRWWSASLSMAIFAALSLRSTGIGFIMITLALGQILWGLAYRWISLTGGDNGIEPARPAGAVRLFARRCQRILLRDARRLPAVARRRWRSSCARRSAPR